MNFWMDSPSSEKITMEQMEQKSKQLYYDYQMIHGTRFE
jgi:hypothetical protein